MKKCVYDDCLNTESTPGVEFHEVFDGSANDKSLGLYICSHHLKQQVEPDKPHQEVPEVPVCSKSGVKTHGESLKFTAEKPKKNRHCCAAGCGVSLFTHPDVGLFKFYPSQKRFEKWCLVADLPIRETRLAFCLCARHFHSECFVDPERRNLKASSDPLYPTGPLNETTGNYCPTIYTNKEPPMLLDSDPERDDCGPNEKVKKGIRSKSAEPEPTLSHSNASAVNRNLAVNCESVSEVLKCSYQNCSNTSSESPNVKFFLFPADYDPRSIFWKKAAGLPHGFKKKDDEPVGIEYLLCSDHFDSSQFVDECTLIAAAMPFSLQAYPEAHSRLPTRKYYPMLRCHAVNCPVDNRADTSAKIFSLHNNDPDMVEKWKTLVGGVKDEAKKFRKFNLCQYHFPEKTFVDGIYRTRLRRIPSLLFPYGPINPKTGDYCPAGQEELSIMYHKERVFVCCVKGCGSCSPLFKFPDYDDEAFDIWCERVGLCRVRYTKEYISNIFVVCGSHFDGRCKVFDTKTNTLLLTYGALPTLRLPGYRGKSDIGSMMLKRDDIPPNSEELANSLLVKPPGIAPTRHIIDGFEGVPPKKMKPNDSSSESVESPCSRGDRSLNDGAPRVLVPKVPLGFKGGVRHWTPEDLLGPEFQKSKNRPSTVVSPRTVTSESDELQVAGDNGEKQPVVSGLAAFGQAQAPSTMPEIKLPSTNALPKVGVTSTNVGQPQAPSTLPGIKPPTTSVLSKMRGKRGPYKKKNWEPDEDRPSITIKEFLDEFVGDLSPPAYSPPSPDWNNPLAGTREAGVQTDNLPEVASMFQSVPPKKTNRKILEKLDELNSIMDIGNEVDVPVISNDKKLDRSCVWSQVTKENALERALIGVFNFRRAGDDNAFSSLSDPSSIPEPQEVDGYNHQYSTYDTVNVIRSAAQLCEFNTMRVQQMEQLIQQDEEAVTDLEELLVKHLAAVMSLTGAKLIKKCFDHVFKDSIARGKDNEQKGGEKTVQVSDGKKNSESCVSNSNPVVLYSAETIQMCQALLAYSGPAFYLLKQIADLPTPQLVRYRSTYPDGSPGYSDQAFKMLRNYHHFTGKLRLCSLSVVDVPLKKEVFWDGKRSFGYEDFGFGYIDHDCIREASKAVVFYVKILSEDKGLPLGYCLADNLNPQVRANLINQYISFVDTVGLRCVAVVCDYSVTTYETYVDLGALSDETDTGWFTHPLYKGVRVFCFTDIFQNVQALSDLWAQKKVFRPTPKAEIAIDRDHITLADAYLKAPAGLSSVPAMTKFLSDLKSSRRQAFKDPLLSNKYDAVMLTILRDVGVRKFASTSQTIKYLESLTAVSDIFSSNHLFDVPDKRPISQNNFAKIQSRLASLSSYFSGLCYGNGTKILSSNKKLPLVFLKLNINSLKGLLRRLFYGDKSTKSDFYCKTLSLEDVYGATATICGGASRLVTPTEFKKGFKKFIDGYTWTPSKRLVCLPQDKPMIPNVSLGFNNTYLYEYSPFTSVSESALEFLTENVIETWLENVKCVECSQLVQTAILTSRDYNLNGNIVRDIHKMIRTAELCLAQHVEIPCESLDKWFSKFSNEILNSLTSVSGFKNSNHLFVSAAFGEICHFSVMVKDMLRIYVQLRFPFMSREERIKIQAPRENSMKFNLGRSWT